MIPVGYMYKKVIQRRDWTTAAEVDDIFSVSGCVSENFPDYINYWKHNGYWLFNSPTVIAEIARDNNIDLTGMTLFYYTAFEEQFDEDSKQWSTFKPEPSFVTRVEEPTSARLEGYDVVA